jgi:hypothetical protein
MKPTCRFGNCFPKLVLAACLSGVIFSTLTGLSGTVNLSGADGERNVVDSGGVPLNDGNQVRIGFFNAGFDIAANSSSLNALAGAWNQFGVTSIQHLPPFGTPQPGRFADSLSNGNALFAGRQISLWIFKTSDNAAPVGDFSNVLEYGLYTSSLANWTFPTLLPSTISSSEADTAYAGDFIPSGPSTFGSLQLTAVPEPGVASLLSLAAALVLGYRFEFRKPKG